ncbi:MAG: hemerythrin domain-containing protein [Candidatus Korobacteraceae bacterium]
MPVQIGAKSHSFSEPTGLLSDCHRRIESFLRALQAVAVVVHRDPSQETVTGLETALRYFREAAPKHTADEEDSLFPRMRALASPEAEAVFRHLSSLEEDHRRADSLHVEVEMLGQEYISGGALSAEKAARFREAVAALQRIYEQHIKLEDELVFPLAKKLLPVAEKSTIAGEMAARRQLKITSLDRPSW